MFNRETMVISVGDAINKLLPEIKLGSKFSELFALTKPSIEFNFDTIIPSKNAYLTFQSKRELSNHKNVILEGPILMVQDGIALLNAETLHVSSKRLVGVADVKMKESNCDHTVIFDHTNLTIPEPNSEAKQLTDLVYDMGPSLMPKQDQQASQTCLQAIGDKTVLVIDTKRLLQLCQNPSLDMAEAVGMLQHLYEAYDAIIEKYKLNKVKARLE